MSDPARHLILGRFAEEISSAVYASETWTEAFRHLAAIRDRYEALPGGLPTGWDNVWLLMMSGAFHELSDNEYRLQGWLKRHVSDWKPGAELVDGEDRGREGWCDILLRLDEKLIPVEVKLGRFDSKAVKQLRRYICFYSADGGIAIGAQLTAKLDDNMEFIRIPDAWRARGRRRGS